MSDRTYFQITFYDCPENQVSAVLDILEEYDLYDQGETFLELGEQYTREKITCGSADTISRQLIERAPQVSFELWEDPAYEWLGDLYRYTPELGVFSAECDAEGTAVFTAEKVKTIVALPGSPTTDPLREGSPRSRALGEDHRAALERLAQKNAGVVVRSSTDDEEEE